MGRCGVRACAARLALPACGATKRVFTCGVGAEGGRCLPALLSWHVISLFLHHGCRYLTDVVFGNGHGMLTIRPAPFTTHNEPLTVRLVRACRVHREAHCSARLPHLASLGAAPDQACAVQLRACTCTRHDACTGLPQAHTRAPARAGPPRRGVLCCALVGARHLGAPARAAAGRAAAAGLVQDRCPLKQRTSCAHACGSRGGGQGRPRVVLVHRAAVTDGLGWSPGWPGTGRERPGGAGRAGSARGRPPPPPPAPTPVNITIPQPHHSLQLLPVAWLGQAPRSPAACEGGSPRHQLASGSPTMSCCK